MKSQDSAGGVVECRITGVPAGLGSPVFEKLDAVLAQAVMSVGAVKACLLYTSPLADAEDEQE